MRILCLTALLLSLLLTGCAGKDYDPTADWTAEDFYREASSALKRAEFEVAIEFLETLEARFPFHRYAKQAQLDVAYAYYKYDEPDSAISAADRFMRLHPRDPHVDYALYLKGLANFYRGKGLFDRWLTRDFARHDPQSLTDAMRDFSDLIQRFPDSRYATDAYRRLVFLRNELAEREVNIAKYYIKRGAWLAAINRAQYTVERYQQTPAAREALQVMVTAYQKLGMDDLAADAQAILAANPIGNTDSVPPPEEENALPPAVGE